MNKLGSTPALLAVVIIACMRLPVSHAAPSRAPKAYAIAEITVTDPVAYKKYIAAVSPVVAHFGGTYIVRGGKSIPVDGNPVIGRFVVIEFKNLAAATNFENSAEYQAIAPLRQRASHSRIFLVEGSRQ